MQPAQLTPSQNVHRGVRRLGHARSAILQRQRRERERDRLRSRRRPCLGTASTIFLPWNVALDHLADLLQLGPGQPLAALHTGVRAGSAISNVTIVLPRVFILRLLRVPWG